MPRRFAFALLFACFAVPGLLVAAGLPVAYAGQGGELTIAPKNDLLRSLGLAVTVGQSGALRLPLVVERALLVELGDGAPTAARDGALRVQGLVLTRRDGASSGPLWLVPRSGPGLRFDLVDAAGDVWLRIQDGMRSPEPTDGLRLITADVRIGPGLAEWSGTDSAGLLLGDATMDIPLAVRLGTAAVPKSCASPNWPDAQWTVDVQLTGIGRIDVLRCRIAGEIGTGCAGGAAYACDGPGGVEGEVVMVPSAFLRNSDAPDAADVPWFAKFTTPDTGLFPSGVDQHPFLVWNLYRLDPDGALVQIARSGLKHAFATQNTGCVDTGCRTRNDILGRGCNDIYDAASNDRHSPSYAVSSLNALAPRSEVVPATGQWGRCGSVFDDVDTDTQDGLAGCDGVFDAPPSDDCDYKYRMVARESEIDPGQQPGARWFLDAWYVVRDDIDIFNTMGFRELQPQWLEGLTPPRWDSGPLGAFRQGTLVDLWLEQAALSDWTQRRLVQTSEGRVLVAVRVRRDGGAYRYDYVVANFDLSRAETDGAEPNLRVLSNLGLGALSVKHAYGATAIALDYRDGDAITDNDWLAQSDTLATTWTAPASTAHLAWGQLTSFTLQSPYPPGEGRVQLAMAAPGQPDQVIAESLVPDASKVFSDRFE